MDRPIVYPSELPMVEDFLGLSKFAYYGLGHLVFSAIGQNTGVAGFAISPTGPASLTVNIGVGSIYSMQAVDASAYSTLGTDANNIMKQGILAAPTAVTLTAPTTSGYSQYYLVQVAFNEADTGAIVPPYVNAGNPAVPLNGVNNLGGSQYTVRQDQAVIALKAGTAVATGSETVPTVDVGYVPLWVIHVTNGQTTITSANWYLHTSAPFFQNLESLAANSVIHYGVDAGTVNTLSATVSPAIFSYADGQIFEIRPAYANTSTTPTLNVAGLGAKTIVKKDGRALGPSDFVASSMTIFAYSAASDRFVLLTERRTGRDSMTFQTYATSSVTLTTADLGKHTNFNAASSGITLPSPSSCPDGSILFLHNTTPGNPITVTTPAGDITVGQNGAGGGITTFKLCYLETVELTCFGSYNNWVVSGGSVQTRYTAQNLSSLGATNSAGYKKLPDPTSPTGYMIFQWGYSSISTGNTNLAVTLPVAFPNNLIGVMASSVSVANAAGASSLSNTQIYVWAINATAAVYYLAWGY